MEIILIINKSGYPAPQRIISVSMIKSKKLMLFRGGNRLLSENYQKHNMRCHHHVVCLTTRPYSFSKPSSPESTLWCFLFQFLVYSRFFKVNQQLLTSSSSFSHPFCLSFNNAVLEDSFYAGYGQSS